MSHLTTLLALIVTLIVAAPTESLAAKREKIRSTITYSAPEKIKELNDKAFDCKVVSHKYNKRDNTYTITFKGNLTTVGEKAFYMCNITDISLPKSVTTIGNYAFSMCDDLSLLDLPQSIKSVGDYAFSGCNNLRGVTIPEGLESIGTMAFAKCKMLTTIELPNSVTTISKEAFTDCPNLKSLTIGHTLGYSVDIS